MICFGVSSFFFLIEEEVFKEVKEESEIIGEE